MRKSGFLATLLLLLTLAPAGAQEPDPRCQAMACRKPGPSTVRLPDGNSISLPKPPAPYFSGSVLSLLPGETILLGFRRTPEGGLTAPVLLQVSDAAGAVDIGQNSADAAAEMTLSFSLVQQDGKPDMMLTVVNKTHMMIKYDAFMYVPSATNVSGSGTSSCPLMPVLTSGQGFSTFESWPHPIALLLIGRIRALPPDATAICN
jgi:hypothetical protein